MLWFSHRAFESIMCVLGSGFFIVFFSCSVPEAVTWGGEFISDFNFSSLFLLVTRTLWHHPCLKRAIGQQFIKKCGRGWNLTLIWHQMDTELKKCNCCYESWTALCDWIVVLCDWGYFFSLTQLRLIFFSLQDGKSSFRNVQIVSELAYKAQKSNNINRNIPS